MDTQEALRWIADIFEEPAGRITMTTARTEIPGWDSLGTLSLIAALDERFDVHLDETEIEAMASVKDIFKVLRRHGAMAEA